MKKIWCLVFLAVLAGCSKDEDGAWLGYAEADYVYVAAPTAGWITALAVERGGRVEPGMALFALDTDSQTASRDQATAAIAQAEQQLSSARANLDLAKKEFDRQRALLKSNATTRQLYDQAKAAFDADAAQVHQMEALAAQNRAGLAGAAYQLSQRTIVSRSEGRVQDIYFRPGEYAGAATPVISILPPNNVYVRFFVPEKQYARLHLGQKVQIDCDGCKPIVATVTFVADTYEYAPPVVFSIASRDKLVFKAEARVEGGIPLHPGQPVDVRPQP
jgi:HlyD family secretion protein